MSLLALDAKGNYYDSAGNIARWSGSLAVINDSSPERQVEITTLPTAVSPNDQMVFILRIEQQVALGESEAPLTHVAVVRDMSMFSETFQVSSFSGQGESYIIGNSGTRVYRGQASGGLIGDVYNVLKPLEKMRYLYGGSFAELRQAVADGANCSLEFFNADNERCYVTSSPIRTNDWSLLGIVPSRAVSSGMQRLMNMMILGMGVIALIVIAAISLTLFLVVRYRAGQQRIRQQAETNAALQMAAEAAQEASRAKTVFLSHMSHDIRTPINGIMGMADIATRNKENQERVADCLQKILSASRHLLSLVNDCLDMLRIESGKVKLDNKPFYIEALLDSCYSVVAGQALKQNLMLKRSFSGITQKLVRGDELHLRQIIINILGNAIKFTPAGGVVSFSAACWEEGGNAVLSIVIQDTGVGMSESFQQIIFEPFSQAEDNGRSRYQGTGLGMSIVKQLLDLMGGTIRLESALGQGSTFTVQLSLPTEQIQEKTAAPENGAKELSGLRVMLVEDNELNMEIAQYILEECGIQVTKAWNGKEALELFVKNEPRSFDLILMDVMMPVMGGLEATREIRASGKSDAKTVPIVAMTANAYSEDKQSALEAGMDRHLAKPMEREELLCALRELCGDAKQDNKSTK